MSKVSENWELKTLKDWGMVAQSGFASGVHNSEGNGVIHLRPMNISPMGKLDFENCKSIEDRSNRRILFGDILFNNTNSAELVGKTTIIDAAGDFAYSNHMTRLRFPKEKIHNKYMAMLLHSMWMSGYFKEICSNHVNQASVSIKRLEQVEVSLPSLEEQRKIVEILEGHLSRLDSASENMKQAILRSGQFFASALNVLFFDSGTYGWDERPFSELGKWITGSTPSSKHGEYLGDDVPFITPGDIANGGVIHKSVRRISNLGADAVRRVKKDSVYLVCIGATLGKVGLATFEATSNQQINALEVNGEIVLPEYAMWFFASPEIQTLLRSASSSTTVPILNKGTLEKLRSRIPDVDTQRIQIRKFNKIVEFHTYLSQDYKKLEKALEAFRRSLLHSAFSGELIKEVANV